MTHDANHRPATTSVVEPVDRSDDKTEVRIDRLSRSALISIAALLMIGFLYLTGDMLVPVIVAALAYLSLRPLVTRLCRLGVPQALGSGLVMLAFGSLVAVIAVLLYSPTQRWIKVAPESLERVRDNFRDLADPLTTIDRADETLQDATESIEASPTEVVVSMDKPSFINETTVINQTVHLLVFIAAIAVLTFFMLSTGDDLLNRMLTSIADEEARREVLLKIGDIQSSVGTYLGQITCINIGLGVAVTLVMWLLDMPTPILWGTIACLFNFIPYVGPIAATSIVLVAAASTFDTLSHALMIAAAFWLTTAVEGQFVTPMVLGRTLKVGPVVVLVAIAFWGFVWGLPGVFLAVPLLIVQRKIFSSFEATYPLAVILGEEPASQHAENEGPIEVEETIAEIAAPDAS